MKLNPDKSFSSFEGSFDCQRVFSGDEMDYQDTFSPVAKLMFVWILVFLAATHHWPLHQLDIRNTFLNGILDDEIIWSSYQVLLLRGSQGRFAC